MRYPGLLLTVLFLILTASIACVDASAEPVRIEDETDRQIVEAFLAHTRQVPERITAERCREMAAEKTEGFTWEIMPFLQMTLVAYELTADTDYLDFFVQTFANMRAAMTEGPDGYLGWYGKALPGFQPPEDPDRPVDVQINSFRATQLLSQFIEHVDKDPGLRERYSEQREQYIDLMVNDLVDKWTARGNYVDLGERGAIYRTHFDLKVDKGNLTQPGNKLSIITHGLLALYRVTGEDRYMKKAVKLGTHFKRRMMLEDGLYTWNYWDPAGAWDVHPDHDNRWKHWIGAEHRAGYYNHSVAFAVTLYHHGVVFDERDIERFLRTQMKRVWNADVENPAFSRVDGRSTDGSYASGALAPWNKTLASFLYGGRRQQDRLERAPHPWQGGPAAAGWIRGKLIGLPAASGGRRLHSDAGEKFSRDPKNRELLEELAFEVAGDGYRPPRTPADWPDMPADPGRGGKQPGQ